MKRNTTTATTTYPEGFRYVWGGPAAAAAGGHETAVVGAGLDELAVEHDVADDTVCVHRLLQQVLVVLGLLLAVLDVLWTHKQFK